jgi:hypothetical protein
MKTFVKENWYKLMIGSSLFIFSVGFFINSISPAYSSNTEKDHNNSFKFHSSDQSVIQMPVNEDGSVNVKLSDEQMEELKSAPQDTRDGKLYIGCGSGIWYTSSSNPTSAGAWSKVD